ncbi:MAG: sigma-54-dependent Fis family transcriptional regulator [Nitrospirae bacterium]|nr:sigma-54-dependent Fis family transcriptional regulator [Nitrospirota bacterium]
MEYGKILIVEDEKSMNEILRMLLEGEGYEVVSAYDGREGLEAVKKDIFDIVLTDIKMPVQTGFEVLREVKEQSPETIVIMITAFGTTEDAIEAMKAGAYDYVNKPFKIDEIRLIIKKALEKRHLSREVKNLKEQLDNSYRFENIIGKSKCMRDLLMAVPRVAESNSNVLLTGETGCGKELLAHAIHKLSKRADKDFVAINCAALPEGLLESELFGHMKGSFTGASSNKEGLFEVANSGTMFLDEIGDMPLALQAKLLRVLEDGTYRRIGGTKDLKTDVRVISATNKILKDESATGRFRTDLYYRLNVIPIHIPPLRNRRDDIPILLDYFLEKNNITNRRFSNDAIDALMKYSWPGNVRELENIIDRVLTFSEKEIITAEELPLELREQLISVEFPPDGVFLDDILMETEKLYLKKALETAAGNKTEAAKVLNISFRQFRHRLKKYGID